MNPLAWAQAWQRALGPAAQAVPPSFALPPGAAPAAFPAAAPPAEELVRIQQDFAHDWAGLCNAASRGELAPIDDPRFAGEAWRASPHNFIAHAYLLSARTLRRMADSVDAPESLRARLNFALMQWIEAMAPSNFLAFNPDAQRRFVESGGESLQHGIANLLGDLRKGRISHTDESSFGVGENLAVTEGSVVFENPLFQLIQYAPRTPKVHARPLLIVPPCINKFYILDLQPHNSLVRFALEQGVQVFLMSWRNPLPGEPDGLDHAGWDDYVEEGVIRAIDVTREISGQRQVNALGFCVGGTLLATALAVLKARRQNRVASLTLLTALLDFSDTGVLEVFIDAAQVQLREQQFARGGLLAARELAGTFAFLRPNDLVWNYVVNNYLKGEAPSPFDLLYWNADSTNLPGPLYAWYLRHTYLENSLRVPGRLTVCGVPLDLTRLDLPAYVYGSREDHIVPWTSAYASTGILRGPTRFVLGASGHIAGVINPASRNKRSYWVNDAPADGAQAWLAGAQEKPGSWWTDWSQWLRARSGALAAAPKGPGSARHPPIEPAPGRYVRARAT
ncbi:class I poly(R)-hydroxyalkanoic acid synthase [Pigmentiphaga soli]|uniref:Class I poly(R)-hydroxyalkanoic acid synthase n=1 Tax=Pigmentiphaga soli TaxID=1007095 RepID=A0ABP8HDK1_9BURK